MTQPELEAVVETLARRQKQLGAVVRLLALEAGKDWTALVERAERRLWAEEERERLKTEKAGRGG